MSEEAIKFKKENINLNYRNMSLAELNKLPPYNGVIEFKITKTSFLILNILNDDSSAVKYFWHGSHDLKSLDLWYEISKEEGIYVDVGAHTGLYTITSIRSNSLNKVIPIEPFYLNMARLITNLRLNRMQKNTDIELVAVSNFDGLSKFKIITEHSYLSKGGKIDNEGTPIKTIKLDSLKFDDSNKKVREIKIDTEGEDLNVLLGAQNLIKTYKPKIIIEIRNENKLKIQEIFNRFNYKLFDISNIQNNINLNDLNIKNVMNVFAKPL